YFAALLWGAAALWLNYVPIQEALFGTIIFLLAGMLSFDSLWWALLPPALYFGIHLAEGETLTPMLLARRTLNPVLVILSVGTARAPTFFALCAEPIPWRRLRQRSPSLRWKDQ